MARVLRLMTVEDNTEVGSVTLTRGKAKLAGAALSVFSTMRRYASSDAELFDLLSGGWSNGAVLFLPSQAGIASTLVAHLPGKHDQSSHGRLGGKEFDDRAVRAKTGSEALESVAYQPSSEAIANALSVYGGRSPGPRSMNRPLREGQELNPETRANIKAMDHAMREGPGIREETLVYRAIPDGGPFGISRDQVQNADLTGLTWQDPAFVSTGVDDWDGRGTMMRILVPAGTPALSNTDRLDNDEIVLDRGLTFRVVADRGPRAGTRTIKVLDVEVSREN